MLDDPSWMRIALELAREAATAGEVPVGAIVVYHPVIGQPDRSGNAPAGEAKVADLQSPRIIGRGFNRREVDHDPSAHAEIVAMREAGRALGSWRLLNCSLYVTLEPCPMCAGAMVQGRLPRLVYGCTDPKAGAVETLYRLCTDGRLNHQIEVAGGIMAEECGAILKTFFAGRRT